MIDDQVQIEEDFDGEIIKVVSKMIVDEDDEDEKKVNNIVTAFNYTPTKMDKKNFTLYLKNYLKKLTEQLSSEGISEDDLKKFKKSATDFVKMAISKFSDVDLYLNDKAADKPFSAMGIAIWVDQSAEAPTFYYLKRALDKVKY